MNTIDNTDEPNTTELVPAISNTGTADRSPSYEIAAEDQHYADSILQIDQIEDVPGVAVVPEGLKLSAPTLEALAPADRAAVRASMQQARLTPAQQAARESEFVEAHLRAQLPRIRVKTGLGAEALPYHRTACHMAREYSDIRAERARFEAELNEVVRHDTQIDAQTGEPRAVPVLAIQGTRRDAYSAHMADLDRRARLLFNADGTPGIEGSKRLRQSLAESVGILKQRDEAAADNAEAKRRAAELVREERINRQAASLARMAQNRT